ncbi:MULTISPECIES: hypothetical protein [Clostridium]|uniref:Uncharacterized protein n=1 Tax=Clostridium innocuum TaxID=1522 RepID=A0A3E2VUA2_CLOIN|nr:hypothetical protein [[Clostridium] innocuum]MCQ5278313.1 hypothetical protein [Clostridium sp. DFI.1.208]RHV63275.1 hypothetical protein DXB22_13005 [Clostridiaceae bacterium OM02-2AC]MCC2845864.1 hypothetical protein [[Clostridium] innocuum]MCC2850070.1 hypothetical protein [[Clostridium] innocuum]MCC2854111.1 hypothetical protein [[Clostridium] innocuum]
MGCPIDKPLLHGARKTARNPDMDVRRIPYEVRDDATPDMLAVISIVCALAQGYCKENRGLP